MEIYEKEIHKGEILLRAFDVHSSTGYQSGNYSLDF